MFPARVHVACARGLGRPRRYAADPGSAILLASHTMGAVERMAADVIMMRRGRVVDRGDPQALIRSYGRHTLEEVFLDVARGTRAGPDAA